MKTGRKLLASTLLAATAMSFCATSANATDLTWAGTDDNNSWNYTDTNWSGGSTFSSGDSATFDNTATNKDVSISGAITADTITVSSGGYTFTFSSKGSVAATSLIIDEGASLVIEGSGVFTGSYSVAIYGVLEISGGTVTMGNYVNAYSGGTLTISGGTITVENMQAQSGGTIEFTGGKTTISDTLYVRSGGTLAISGGTITLSSAISNSGTVTIDANSDVVFVLDNLTSSSGTYTIVSGGTITGWGTLTKSNFLLNSSESLGHVSVDVSTAGKVTLKTGVVESLVWNGTSSNNAWTNGGEEIWLNDEDPDVFYTNDNVTFSSVATNKTVSISEEIVAGSVTVSGGSYTFLFSDEGSVAASRLTVSSGASLLLSDNATLTVSGTTTINGTFVISGGKTTFSSSITVRDGGMFEITGGETTISSSMNIYGMLVEISGGTTTISGSLYVESGGALTLSGGTITLSSAISNSDTVTIDASNDVVFVLDNLTVNRYGTYTIISGGTIEGWDTLTNLNFMLDGSLIKARVVVDVSTKGQVKITDDGSVTDLVWNGTASSNVWTNNGEEIWEDSLGIADSFRAGDSVTFGADGEKTVSVVGAVEAGTITVSAEDYTFILLDDASITASSMYVGRDGTGTLTISCGEVTFGSESEVYIGYSGGTGALTISGGEVTFGSGSMYIGYSGGTGALTISGGETTFESGSMYIGHSRSTGALTISGGETTFKHTVYVGYGTSGSGTLEISGGETTFGSSVYLGSPGPGTSGTGGSATGTVTISGEDTLTTFNGSVDIGYAGGGRYASSETSNGTFTIYDGTTIFQSYVRLGNACASNCYASGTLTIYGGETTFNRTVTVGDSSYYSSSTNATGDGVLKILGGTVTFNDVVYIAYEQNPANDVGTATGVVEISGEETVVNFNGDVYIGDANTYSGTATGSLTISNKETTFSGTVYLGYSTYTSTVTSKGTIEILDGKTTFESTVYLGYSPSSYGSGTGTIKISGGETTFKDTVYLGYALEYRVYNKGTIEISGGKTTFLEDVYIGYYEEHTHTYASHSSNSTIEISGGEATFSHDVYLGYINDTENGTSDCSITISGGETTFGGYVYLGYIIGSSGTSGGTITISDGETTFESIVFIGYSPSGSSGTSSSNGTIKISGGETTFKDTVYVGYVDNESTGTGVGTLETTGGNITFLSEVRVISGSELTFSGGTITLSSAVSNSGTVTIDTGGENNLVFVLDNLESVDGTYTLITGGTITGWSTLTKSNFQLNGSGLGRVTVNVSVGGQVTITEGGVADLVWNGTSSDNIWKTEGKDIWLNDGYEDEFVDGDSVTFDNTAESKTVKVEGAIDVVTATVSATGYTFTLLEDASVVAESLTIDSGASLTIEGSGVFTASSATISGTIQLSDGATIISDVSIETNGEFDISGGTTTIDSMSVEANGSLTISGGTVSVTGSLTSTGSISVSGGSLELSGTVDISSAIENSGIVTISDSVMFILDNLISNGDTYTIISGGSIEGWNALTKSNFLLNGKGLGRSTIDVSTAGQVTITAGGVADLVWNGTSSDNIWKTNGEDVWLLSDGTSDAFMNGDSVTFDNTAESKTVIVEGSVNADTVVVKSGNYTFTGDGSITTESLVVDSGASLSLEGSGELTVSSAEINGALAISGGSVSVTDTLTSTGSISVSGSASLELSGTVDISSAISNEGTVTVTDNVVFVLDNLGEGDTYTIISGGTIEGWDTLTKSNFQLNGSGLGRATIDVSVGGQVTITEGGIGDLVWNGTASSNVWTNNGEEIWLNDEDPDVFIENDNVTFGVDGTKSVSIVGTIEAGTVTVSGSGYTFDFSDDSSVTANSLIIDSGASLEITNGETTITNTNVSSEGTLKISGGTTTAASIEVAGSLELTGGELTVKSIILSDGSGSFSGGILNVGEITGDGALTFGNGLTVNLYETTSLNADITLSGNVTFNAEDGESIELSGTLSGGGKLVKDGKGILTLSGDNTFSGGATISSGTVVAQSETALGSGSITIDDGATLEIPTSREFTNATSGNGTMSIASGATVSFTKSVGVRTVEVAYGATLSGSTSLTHTNAQLVIAGELALDASAGEIISFSNSGTVTLESSATLNLSGVSPTSVKPLSDSSALGAGSNVTIVSGATVEGDIKAFLATDNTLSTLADTYAVVYDTSKGLSVMILESGDVSSISSGVKLHDGISSDFLSAIVSDDDLDFGTGIKSSDELQSLSNPIVKALATGNISEASKMMDTLAPNDYAAMVAMPTTSFYNDVKAIDNHLAARRERKLDENNRWGFFAQAQGTFIENDDANDTQTFDFDLYGVLAGADYRVNEGLTVGVTVGYDYGKADIHNGGGKIESDDVRIAVFAGQQIGEMFFVNAGAQVGYGHYEAKRKTAYGNANGDTDGWNAGLFADVGMMLTLSEELKISARPYVGLAYLHSEVGSFDDGLFDVDDFHGDSLRASIGCGVFWGFDLAETACSVGIDASYSHDFCGDEVDIDATYMDTGKDFGLTAKALSKDLFSVGPVIGVGLSESVSLFAGYALQVGTDSSIGQNAYVGARVSF